MNSKCCKKVAKKASHTTAIASPLPKAKFQFSCNLGTIVTTLPPQVPSPYYCTLWPDDKAQQCHGGY